VRLSGIVLTYVRTPKRNHYCVWAWLRKNLIMSLFVRVSESYASLEGFFSSLSDVCGKLIVYEHSEKSSNVHVHFYTEECAIKPDAMKIRIKKHLHVTSYDKTKWSFKTASDPDCIVYMSKGRLEPCLVKGFTQDEVVAYKDRWVERTSETSHTTKAVVSQYDMSMEVFDLICKKYHIQRPFESNDLADDFTTHHQDAQDIYSDCIRYAMKVCRKHRKGFDENSIRKIVSPAFTRFTVGQECFVNKLVRGFFSQY